MNTIKNQIGVSRTDTADSIARRNAELATYIYDHYFISKDVLQDLTAVDFSMQERCLKVMERHLSRREGATDMNEEYFMGLVMNYCAAFHIVYPEKYQLPDYWDNMAHELDLECTKSFLSDLINKKQER